jgi:hypothetical protein
VTGVSPASQPSRAINTSNGGEQSGGSSNNRWKYQKKKKKKKKFTKKVMVNADHSDTTGTSSATILSEKRRNWVWKMVSQSCKESLMLAVCKLFRLTPEKQLAKLREERFVLEMFQARDRSVLLHEKQPELLGV